MAFRVGRGGSPPLPDPAESGLHRDAHMKNTLQTIAQRFRPPRRIGVREAWLNHERYVGQRVSLHGIVRVFDADLPSAYFTLDDDPARVGLRAEATLLQPLVGRAVRAIGHLTFKPGVGIFLDVESITKER